MSTIEIVNRLTAAMHDYESARDGSFPTDVLIDTAEHELYKAVELLTKLSILPAEALEAV